jgi:hypothetical protein
MEEVMKLLKKIGPMVKICSPAVRICFPVVGIGLDVLAGNWGRVAVGTVRLALSEVGSSSETDGADGGSLSDMIS